MCPMLLVYTSLLVQLWGQNSGVSGTLPGNHGPLPFILNWTGNSSTNPTVDANIEREIALQLVNKSSEAELDKKLEKEQNLENVHEMAPLEIIQMVETIRETRIVSAGDVKLDVNQSKLECFSTHRYCFHNRSIPDTCSCKADCVRFGNCCWDAPASPDADTVYFCSKVPTSLDYISYKMVSRCPSYWIIQDVRDKCESVEEHDTNDLLTWVPVTNNETNTTYKNAYCASCHRDKNTTSWKVGLQCPYNEFKNASVSNMSLCQKSAEMPKLTLRPRVCTTIDTCDRGWMLSTDNKTASEYRRRCWTYRAPVQTTKQYPMLFYKNKFCAFCNNVKAEDLQCYFPLIRNVYENNFASPPRIPSFSFLMDIDFSQGDGVGSRCKEGHVYNPIKQVCRAVWCGNDFVYHDGVCVEKAGESDRIFDTDNLRRNCTPRRGSLPRVEVDGIEIDHNYSTDGNSSDFCQEDDNLEQKFNDVQSLLTLVCTGISLTCLLIKMALYFLERADRTKTASRAIFYLSGTLFVAQLFFLAGAPRNEWGAGCVAVALVTHYAFLSSFHWTNVLAFDIWRTFSVLTAPESSSSDHKSRKRFLRYALYSWLTPFLIVGTASLFEWGLPLEDWRPMYGTSMCWINRRRALLVFFALPLAFLLFFNLVFFLCTAFQICRAVRASRFARERSSRDCVQFGLYVKLALIMGLTWASGFVAPFANHEVFWYVFIVLNGLQGAFILLAFTQFGRMWRALRQIIKSESLNSTSGTRGTTQESKTGSTKITTSSIELPLPVNVTSHL